MKLSSQRFWKPKKIILIYSLKFLFLPLMPIYIAFLYSFWIIKWSLFNIDFPIFNSDEINSDCELSRYYSSLSRKYVDKIKIKMALKMNVPISLIIKWIWTINPKTLDEWEYFCGVSGIDVFEDEITYEIFMTYKREFRVKKFLEKVYGWEVEKANSFFDRFWEIDLFALNKDGKDCVIQVKTKLYQDLKINNLLKYAKANKCIPYLAIVTDDSIKLKKLK